MIDIGQRVKTSSYKIKGLKTILCSDDNLTNKEYWKMYKRPNIKFSPQRKIWSLYEVINGCGPLVRTCL